MATAAPLLDPDQTEADERDDKPIRTRQVIANPLLKIANEVLRTMNELEPSDRKRVMQIVNLLVESPESEVTRGQI